MASDKSYIGHCIIDHIGTINELAISDCIVCATFAEIMRIYSNFTYMKSQIYDDSYVRHGFQCEYGHEFYVANVESSSGLCPICDVISYSHKCRCEEVVSAKVRKNNTSIDPRSRKPEKNQVDGIAHISATSLDHGSSAGYKTTMGLIEKSIIDVKPGMFVKLPAIHKIKQINTFVRSEQLETDLEYITGIVYDNDSLIKWKCNRRRHNPHCTNRKCMLLTATGAGVISRDESCDDLVICNCVFVASINTMFKHKNVLECDIDHRIKVTSMMYESCRVFETIFGGDFHHNYDVDDRVNNRFRFDGYNPELKIGFRFGHAKDSVMDKYCAGKNISLCMIPRVVSNVDQCIIHIIDWIYTIKMNHQKRFANTDALIANIDRAQLTELLRRLLHIYNRRHIWM